jgi:mono/diheme cytochrome c family protein
MIKKILKITGIVLGSIIGLALIAFGAIYIDMNMRINKTYSINPEPIHVTYDSVNIELGRRLVGTRVCAECHGEDFGGKTIFEDGLIGRVSSRNITKGKGGLPEDYSEADWVMALKHGLDQQQKPLLFMPSNEFTQMSEGDMAAIIAYMSTVPKVDREDLPATVGPMGLVLGEFNVFPLVPADKIDHSMPFAKEIQPGVNVEYGKYLAVVCTNCHGLELKGKGPMVPGGSPIPDLTSTGNASKWTHDEFITTLHTGVRPNGQKLNDEMPWKMTLSFTAEELTAIHLYAQSIE